MAATWPKLIHHRLVLAANVDVSTVVQFSGVRSKSIDIGGMSEALRCWDFDSNEDFRETLFNAALSWSTVGSGILHLTRSCGHMFFFSSSKLSKVLLRSLFPTCDSCHYLQIFADFSCAISRAGLLVEP